MNRRWISLCIASVMSVGAHANNFVPPESPYSFVKPNTVSHPVQSRILAGYFDIEVGAPVGSKVLGKIQISENHSASEQNLSERYQFALKGGSDKFKLVPERDEFGRIYASLVVSDASATKMAQPHPLTVELIENGQVVASKDFSVHVVEKTVWETVANNYVDYIEAHTRLGKRHKLKGKKLKELVKYVDANEGRQDLDVYQGVDDVLFDKIGKNALTKQLEKANTNIGAMGYAYQHDKRYKSDKTRQDLRNTMYQAIIALAQIFPYESLEEKKYLIHNYASHQWRFTDGVVGAFGYIATDMYQDIQSGNPLASEAQAMLAEYLGNVNFALLPKYRDYQYPRYFQSDASLLSLSNGSLSDANRHHRQRSWLGHSVLNMDYNRPLTYNAKWFDGYGEFGKQGTRVLPTWVPQGSFADVKTWLDTNNMLSHRYGQSGLLPDGSVSHHIGSGQDMAHIAYGFEWQAKGITDAANVLYGTPFEVDNAALEAQRGFILNSYPQLVYKDVIDFQTAGRSHYSENVLNFGTGDLMKAINGNLKVKSSKPLALTERLEQFKRALKKGESLATGVYPMWANDFIVVRDDSDIDSAYYLSVKMQSNRTVGAEGFKGTGDHGFHNGSGVVQIKTQGDEYATANRAFDWHALPGTTEELREDKIPLSSKNKGYNPNSYSGVNSLGSQYAVAAFDYDRIDPYASAAASKSWFINANRVVALGNQINRTKAGQGKPIVTTVDQAKWYGDLTYYINGEIKSVRHGESQQLVLASDKPMWFHQGDKGYVIVPQATTDLMVRTGAAVNQTEKRDKYLSNIDKADRNVFQIAVNHGVTPSNESYRYVAVAGVTLAEMHSFVDSLKHVEMINRDDVQAVFDAKQQLAQVAFKKAGTVTFESGLTLSSDQAALVQIVNSEGRWAVSVTDPLASVSLKEIQLTVNRVLPQGKHQYTTQGVESVYVTGQDASVTTKDGVSVLKVALPDESDAQSYRHRVGLYAGMPAELRLN